MAYEIQDDIPIPGRFHRNQYPIHELEVGQSFFAAGRSVSDFGGYKARVKPRKFLCRTVTENGVKGVRVWRIE